MVEDPVTYADVFIDAGADVLTFHAEALDNDVRAISALCAHIRERGVLAGVSVKPGTPADFLLPLLDQMDLVLVMSVEPGFGGQAFQPQTLEKVRLLRSEIEAWRPAYPHRDRRRHQCAERCAGRGSGLRHPCRRQLRLQERYPAGGGIAHMSLIVLVSPLSAQVPLLARR